MHNIEAIERRLWSADQLRGNSEFASNEYFLPIEWGVLSSPALL
jgi:type I restriction enzyme M protein